MASFTLDGRLSERTKSMLNINGKIFPYYGRPLVKEDTSKMSIVCGGLDFILDFDKSTNIMLSWVSQMWISFIVILNVGMDDRIQKFVLFLFLQTWKRTRQDLEISGLCLSNMKLFGHHSTMKLLKEYQASNTLTIPASPFACNASFPLWIP